eukprot:TRINITY_DN5325_c0_g1_i1.p1 TRINITY_DN5325_c0_g1~~TRINITY_DN5325_c0_g1_i1.p1  ORF type:complete len:622 (+),score=275.31 TRINITY_DN5325_c0_g1_i1:162-1868(+)
MIEELSKKEEKEKQKTQILFETAAKKYFSELDSNILRLLFDELGDSEQFEEAVRDLLLQNQLEKVKLISLDEREKFLIQNLSKEESEEEWEYFDGSSDEDNFDWKETEGREEIEISLEDKLEFLCGMFPSFPKEFLRNELGDHDLNLQETMQTLLPLTLIIEEDEESTENTIENSPIDEENHQNEEKQIEKRQKRPYLSVWRSKNANITPNPPPKQHSSYQSAGSVHRKWENDSNESENETEDAEFEEKVERLSEMFPSLGRWIIVSQLEENEENLEETAEALFEHSSNQPEKEAKKKPEKKQEKEWSGNRVEKESLVQKLRLEILQKRFFWIDPSILHSVFEMNGRDLSKSAKILSEMYPNCVVNPNRKKEIQKPIQNPQRIEETISTETKPKRRGDSEGFQLVRNKRNKKIKKKREKDEYAHMSERDKANYFASLRNEYYKQAAGAFLCGDVVSAGKLSSEGKYWDRMMKHSHQQACSEALANVPSRGGMSEIDLHGFQVKPALELVEKVLSQQENRGHRLVSIIVGAGNHSEGGRARIKPAVRSWLTEQGYRYHEANAGTLVVQL